MNEHGWGPVRRVFRLPRSRRQVAGEVDAELRFHVEERIEEFVAGGMSPAEAEREARERFGSLDTYRRETRMIDERIVSDRRRAEAAGALARDIRLAARTLARRPLFTLVVILTLALGIGANTAIFSIVNSVLMRPLPTPWLGELVAVYDEIPPVNLTRAELSPPEVMDLIEAENLFATATGYSTGFFTLTALEEPRRVRYVASLGDFFGTFGVRPAIGRLYRPEESEAGRPPVAVLSHALWQDLFGGDPAALGTSLDLSGTRYEVVGVLPPDFRYPRSADLYTPFEYGPEWTEPSARGRMFMHFVGRMPGGATFDGIVDRLDREVDAWIAAQGGKPEDRANHFLSAQPFRDHVAGQLRPILLVLMGAVGFVLLIACANVGSLMLVRAAGRTREVAVRVALGASRWAVARYLLVESGLLSVAGGVVGLAIGALVVRVLAASEIAGVEALQDVRLDGLALAFTAVVTIVAAMLFGVLPALRAAGVDPQATLKDSSRGSSGGVRRGRALQASVVAQVALTLVLLLASALTIRSLANLLAIDPGFRAEQVMTARVSTAGPRYPSGTARTAFFESLVDRLQGAGLDAVGIVSYLPFHEGFDSSPFALAGIEKEPGEPERHAQYTVVGGDFFRALGIPIVRGRAFDETDPPAPAPPPQGAPLPPEWQRFRFSAIIDETLAKKYFGDRDPVGQIISQGPEAIIVGVAGAVRNEELGKEPYPTVYYLQRQYNWISTFHVVARTALPPATVTSAVRAAVKGLDPDVPVYDALPMQERIDTSVATRRLAMTVLTGFAIVSLLLALLGVYGVISYGISQRTQEIGIRMALGAQPGDVVSQVLRQGVALAVVGAVAGAALFLGVGQVLASLVYGVDARDPLVIAGGVTLLVAVAALACWLPARRAAAVSPVEALRAD